MNIQDVIRIAHEEYSHEKQDTVSFKGFSDIFSGSLRPLCMRFICWISGDDLTEKLHQLIEKNEITPQELRWFSHTQLRNLQVKITNCPPVDSEKITTLFKRAICHSVNSTTKQDLAEIVVNLTQSSAPSTCWTLESMQKYLLEEFRLKSPEQQLQKCNELIEFFTNNHPTNQL